MVRWIVIFGMKVGLRDEGLTFCKSKSKIKVKNPQKTLFWTNVWVQRLCIGLIRTREGQIGYIWQHANYFWHLAKCFRTTGGFLQKVLPVLASCQILQATWAVAGPDGQLASLYIIYICLYNTIQVSELMSSFGGFLMMPYFLYLDTVYDHPSYKSNRFHAVVP